MITCNFEGRFAICILCHCLVLSQILLLIEAGPGHGSQAKSVVDRLTNKVNYTRQNSPHGDKPTNVSIGIYIIGFYSISEQTMDYSVTIYLRLSWFDPRLRYNPKQVGNRTVIKLEEGIWDQIWVPDVFFRNEKKASFHHLTIPNRFMNLYNDGKIWYVIKISVTLSCMMDLSKYPLDTQDCPMMLESFGHTMDTVQYRWLANPVDKDDLKMPQFQLIDSRTSDCSKNYTTGAYPCLQIDFVLQRDIGYFIIQVYVPSVLIVILSWVAFWLNIEAIPARVSLGLLTVLTMTTQSSGARASLPKVSYIKAIDVWMSACLIFVFLSLLEFAVVNVYSRRDEDEKAKIARRLKMIEHRMSKRALKSARSATNSPIFSQNRKYSKLPATGNDNQAIVKMPEDSSTATTPQPAVTPVTKTKTSSLETAKKIDAFSRRFFPFCFIIFNTVYWIYYGIAT